MADGESPFPGMVWSDRFQSWMSPTDAAKAAAPAPTAPVAGAGMQGSGQYAGQLPSGQVVRFASIEEMEAAGAVNPTVRNLAESCAAGTSTSSCGNVTYNGIDISTPRGVAAAEGDKEFLSIQGQLIPVSGPAYRTYYGVSNEMDPMAASTILQGAVAASGLTSSTGHGMTTSEKRAAEAAASMPAAANPTAFLQGTPGIAPAGSLAGPTGFVASTYTPMAGGVLKNLYLPEGSYAQQQFEGVKLGLSKPGEFSVYEPLGKDIYGTQRYALNPETGKMETFILAGGGSRAALQSGMVGLMAATPAVYSRGQVQRGVAGLTTPNVMAPGVERTPYTGAQILEMAKTGVAPAKLSRLGAEAYGGIVSALDNRTLGTITYEDISNRAQWNLAAYVSPQAANLGKAALPGANIPWSVPVGAPAFFEMTPQTRGGEGVRGITLPATMQGYIPAALAQTVTPTSDRLVGGKTVAAVPAVGRTGDLPMPFLSAVQAPAAQAVSTITKEPTVFDILGESVSRGISMIPGGVGVAFAYDIARGKQPMSNLYQALDVTINPPAKEKNLIAPETYESNLATYNKALGEYNVKLAAGTATAGEYSKLSTAQKELEAQREKVGVAPTAVDKALGVYDALNKDLARYTTDIAGLGAAAAKAPDVQDKTLTADIANFMKAGYVKAAESPLDLALGYGGGMAYTGIKGAVKAGVAKSAMSGLPVLGTGGRALSTPLAADIGGVAEKAVGGYLLFEAGMNIAKQPTPQEKGRAAGGTAVQLIGFGAGMTGLKVAEPVNYYAGREFFSGQLGMGPIEKAQFKVATTVRSLLTENTGAYRDVATITPAVRFIEPPIKAEPKFETLSRSGPYAKEIRATVLEQPHSVLGSSTVEGQYPKTISESAGIRRGKDVDVFIESPSRALQSLEAKTGLQGEAATSVMDAHVIPKGYPGYKPSVEAEATTTDLSPKSQLLNRILGDPYADLAFPRGTSEIIGKGTPGYSGELSFEQSSVQMGRKAQATAFFLADPVARGYRGPKDVYDFISLYKAQREVAISRGASPKDFATQDRALENLMERKVTYNTQKGQGETVTKTIREIYKEQAAANAPIKTIRQVPREGGIPSAMSKGFTSATSSAIAGLSSFVSPLAQKSPSPASSRKAETPSFPSANSPLSKGISSVSKPSTPSKTSPLSQIGVPSLPIGSKPTPPPSAPSAPSVPSTPPSVPSAPSSPPSSPSGFPPIPSVPLSTKPFGISTPKKTVLTPPALPFWLPSGGSPTGGRKKPSRKYIETLGFATQTRNPFFMAMGKAGIASVNAPVPAKKKRGRIV